MQLLSLALFMAQWGMVAHASTHLKADPHAAAAKTQVCGECLCFASMHNAVGNAPSVALTVKAPVDRIDGGDAVAVIPPRAFDAFRSRAPPVSL